MSRIGILYRESLTEAEELKAIIDHFDGRSDRFVTNSRMDIKAGDLVIGRYSVLPFYQEQENDIRRVGAQLINTHRQHLYIAEMEYVHDLKELTPKTWFMNAGLGSKGLAGIEGHDGSFVVKGVTNSRKHDWERRMFAKDRDDIMRVVSSLSDDALISQQGVVIREYVPLYTYLRGINNLPITQEYRCFMFDGECIAKGFYWQSSWEEVCDACQRSVENWRRAAVLRLEPLPDRLEVPNAENVPDELLEEVGRRVGDKCRFYTVDVAKKKDGGWTVIELNDGQMAGLSMCNERQLYAELASRG